MRRSKLRGLISSPFHDHSSGRTSPCTASVNLTGTGGNDWFIGPAGALYSITGAGAFGFTPFNTGGFNHTIPTTAGGFFQMHVTGQSGAKPARALDRGMGALQ
jgi:hypothetical protein